jgi:hypothetical protein
MDHPECILVRLSTENTGRRQEKHKKAQHRKKKDMQHGPQEQQWVNLGARER